jgi:putative transposase
MSHREVVTRRHLPHWYVPGAMHFVTYRLAETLPLDVIEFLRRKRATLLRQMVPDGGTAEQRADVHKQVFAAYDHYLDRVCKVDWLGWPAVAAMIRKSLYHHNGSKYHLLAYCVMPNHVHVLFQPLVSDPRSSARTDDPAAGVGVESPDAAGPLAGIMHSLKSYTANEANKLLGRSGQFWQHESYDHWVRDDDELERIVIYIAGNPVKAGLVHAPHEWYFSSAHDRYLDDGEECGWLAYPPA